MAMVYVRGTELGNRKERVEKRHDRKEDRWERRGSPAPRRDAPKLIETKDNFSQIKIFPHGVVDVANAGDPADFNQVAQNAFLPIRGIMQAETSLSDVEADEIKVGNVSQLVVASTFPGQMFSPQADDVLCDLDVVPPGIQFILQSVSQSAQRVTLGWFGHFFSSISLMSK